MPCVEHLNQCGTALRSIDGFDTKGGDRVREQRLRQQDFVMAVTVNATTIGQGIEKALAYRWATTLRNAKRSYKKLA
jgi:hypothetical protein